MCYTNNKGCDYMLKRNNKKDSLDVEKINEGVILLNKMLKISFIALIVAAIMLVTYIFKEWKIFNFIGILLKTLSPLFIGIVIAWLFNPIVKFLTKRKMNRVLATVIVYITFVTLLVLLCIFSVPTLTNQINDFINMVPNLTTKLSLFIDKIFSIFEPVLQNNIQNVKSEMFNTIIAVGKQITITLPEKIITIGSSLVSGIGTFVIGLFIGLYMLFDFDNVSKVFLGILPVKARTDAKNLMNIANKTLFNYIQGLLVTMTLVFVENSIGFSLAGLNASILFAFFCGLTNAIPYVGPWIGGIPAVIVGFTQGLPTGIFVIISLVIAQMLDNVIFTPLVQSKGLKLHPVTVIIALLVFGKFFGIIGMIIAAPCVAIIKTICGYFNTKYELIKLNDEIQEGVKNIYYD